VECWGVRKFAEGVGVEWKKNGKGGGGGKHAYPLLQPRILAQPFIGQVSNYNSKWRHRKPGLLSVLFQNNACTAGYLLSNEKVVFHIFFN